MPRFEWRPIVVGLVVLAGAGGYGLATPAAATARPAGVTLGHVAVAPEATSASIVIGPGAATHGYSTKVVTISKGASLDVVNLHAIDHTVTAVADNGKGLPLFNAYASAGKTTKIPAASKLAPGTYDFYCEIHPSMRGVLVVEGTGGGTRPVPPSFNQPLHLPKVLTGSHIRIAVGLADVRVLPDGPKTPMWTYGGSYPGPTILRPAGHDTKVTFVNDLPSSAGSITVHLHGDHHSSANDGQPDSHLIAHGAQRTYDYPLTDGGKAEPAAFYYYHDHRMNETGRNNWMGLQGMFITTSPHERALDLPTGRYDLPLLVSDRTFTAGNQLTDPFGPQHDTGADAPPGDATVGNQILVDGRFAPYLDVATHRYRLRLLNASNFQSYDFALSDGQPFTQIGTGDDLLPQPVVRHAILLGPSQRADVIVDFHGDLHRNVVLESVPLTDDPPSGIGTPAASIMQFRVTAAVVDHTRIPSELERPPVLKAPKKPSMTWTFGLGGNAKTGTYWTINGRPFDPHRVDVEVPLGSTQTWLLRNISSITHYVHLHEEEWHTISINGRPPPAWERGLEDTWRLDPGETIKVAARFTDYTGIFMVHCHMLDHEDDGMMAQFAVVRPHTTALPAGYYLASSQRAANAGKAMTMSMTVSSPVRAPSGGPASRWSRRLVHSAEALAIELAILTLGVSRRHYRRRAA